MSTYEWAYRILFLMTILFLCALLSGTGGTLALADEALLQPAAKSAVSAPAAATEGELQEEGAASSSTGKKRRLRNSRWIFLGDSYFMHARKWGWERSVPDLISYRLKISWYRNISRGGYGFARGWRPYIELVEKRQRRRDVTDVLIYGGIFNDGDRSLSKTRKAIRKTIQAVRNRYPNATIWYANCSWYCSEIPAGREYRRRILRRYPRYAAIMEGEGVRIVDQVEDVLRNCGTEYFLKDYHHPSYRGIKKVANALAVRIRQLYS